MAGGEAESRVVGKAAEGVIARVVGSMVRDAEAPIAKAAATDVAGDTAGSAERTAAENASKYEFNMVDNPGPLADNGAESPALNFAGGRYNEEVLPEDTVLFRAGNDTNPFGQYFTRQPPSSELQTRIDGAVEWAWRDREGNITGYSDLTHGYALRIPKGSTVYSGPTASRGGILVGGKEQIYVRAPWDLEGVEVLDKWPLP